MPENKKTPQKEIASTGDANADYAGREAWDGEDEEGDKKFTNANANSTYVEMTGTLYLHRNGMGNRLYYLGGGKTQPPPPRLRGRRGI